MICDRVALTCEAVQYLGAPEPVAAFIGRAVTFYYDRHVIISPDHAVWTFLTHGDWVVRGVGPDWDFYVIPDRKFRKLWRPRAEKLTG
jgi:hypothetical protein